MWKKHLGLALLCICASTIAVLGQNKHYLGPTIGLGMGNEIFIQNDKVLNETKFKFNYNFGVEYALQANDFFSLNAHLLFIEQGSKNSFALFNDKQIFAGTSKSSTYSTVQLCLGGNIYFSPKHQSYLGASFSFINGLSYKYKLEEGGAISNSDYLRNVNTGAMIRIGHRIPFESNNLAIELRALTAFSDVYRRNPYKSQFIVPYTVCLAASYQILMNKNALDKEPKED